MWKKLLAGVSVFSASVGVTYLTLTNQNGGNSSSSSTSSISYNGSSSTYKETAGEKLFQSLLGYEAMDIKGDVKIVLENQDEIKLKIDGQGSIADINNIQLAANLDLNLAGIKANGQLGYFKDTLTFAVDDVCAFKLATDDLLDFIEMIPTYGVSVNLPDSLGQLDTTTLLNSITSLENEDVRTLSTGDRFYRVSLGEDENAVDIDVLADENDNLLGFKIDHLDYQGTEMYLRVDLTEICTENLAIVNPLETENAYKYQDFKPVFTLIDNLFTLANSNQFGVTVNASLTKGVDSLLDSEINLNVDKDENKVGLDLTLLGEEDEQGAKKRYTLNTALIDGTIYAKFHNVAVSIDTVTISDLINYVFDQVSEQLFSTISEKMESGLSSIDFNEITSEIKNVLKSVNISNGELSFTLNVSGFGIDMLPTDDIVITIKFNDSKLESISLSPITISDYTINLSVDFVDYKTVSVDPNVTYTALEPSAVFVQSALDFIKQKAYYIGFDIDTDDHDGSTTDLSMDGFVQLDFVNDNHYGYGEATIIDSNNYRHNLKADMYDQGNFIFSYNDKLKGKFNSDTVKELAELVSDIVTNPDDHFIELFGELLEKMNSSTISKIIAGDYLLALDYDLISNLDITDNKTSLDLSLAIFGMEEVNMHIEIGYTGDTSSYASASLDYITISNLTLMDRDIDVTIDFAKYKNSLDANRLNQFDTYLDFSHIKTLLALGVNTSKFNFYHFTSNIAINLKGLLGTTLMSINLPLDVKIRNEKGDVTVAMVLSDIPVKSLVNPNEDYASARNRSAFIYFQNEYWYIHREEEAKKKGFLGIGTGSYKKYEINRTCTTEYFLDNIATILLDDILGVKQSYLDMIDGSTSSSTNEIKYEDILEDFSYSESKSLFNFSLNMEALTGTSLFDYCKLGVYEDTTNNILKAVEAKIKLSFGLKLEASFTLNFENDRSIDVFTRDEQGNLTDTPKPGTTISGVSAFVSAHSYNGANKLVKSFGGSVISTSY